MADREKVIERLGKVSYYFKSLLAVGWQGDADIYREHMESVNMALAMLKEQEPVEPVQHLVYTTKGWFCGACDGRLNRLGKYCSFCGRLVKWDEA